MNLETIAYLMPLAAVIALVYAAYLFFSIKKKDEGTEKMREISAAIREGAHAYLKRQYVGVIIVFAVVAVAMFAIAPSGLPRFFAPLAFISGGLFSGLAGYVGMTTATNSNARTAQEASQSLNRGLKVAFSSGSVMGLTVVGLALVHISVWYFGLNAYLTNVQYIANYAERMSLISSILLISGMGASLFALFARVGGGIFTKAADVGADLVGKVENNIPEDDPRNPAVIADNVGDNVGDVAGMGADLYESYVGSIIAASSLSIAGGFGMKGIILIFLLAACGLICSIIGGFFVKTKENTQQSVLLAALRRGVNLSSVLVAVVAFFLVRYILGPENLGIYWSILAGLLAGVIIGLITEYFTSAEFKPTKNLASTATTGPATIIIDGLAVGMQSTAMPVIVVGIAVLVSYFLSGGASNASAGLFGISIAAVGMLSTLGITLATDAYGPVADNAGGIAEMAGLPPYVRERTDALDSLGNTTAATGKGFAIGSAALTALALIATFKDKINIDIPFSLLNPQVLIGLFIGGMLPFLFAAMTMKSVGRSAQSIVVEVRRQFKEIKGLMEGTAKADYAKCVDICTRAAQKEMILPALTALIAPILTGLILGVEGVGGLLVGTVVTGFVLAIMMSNSGGSWDNAKKYIETGELGGKGSEAHKAAVVGDTVGDPFKDTSGPALNILIKLVSVVAVVFATVIMTYSLL